MFGFAKYFFFIRTGKSSILKVIFEKMNPQDTVMI